MWNIQRNLTFLFAVASHFNKNREERWVMRENLREAKIVQNEEEERLQIEKMKELELKQEL